ncbi:ABC transporter ATP-binding protein [Marinomonas sp. C1424]|uniref:ABC transporter ATP-binding protein n=2 Tax=Marinomonas transparens TaxID=2795388 RepID=A0A934N343_9GAMM|nr:ABC transporter ATP-binding protein [Marinomonas transparens]
MFALPAIARRRLMSVGIGWILVAALEALAYTILALGIVDHWSPKWILISAGITILVTTLVNRSGYLTGIRLAGDLFSALGQSLSRTKLSWFTNEHRAQVATIAGQGIPGLMSIPAHQLQHFLHAPCIPLFLIVGIGLIAGPEVALAAAILLALSLMAQFLSQRALGHADRKRHDAEAKTSEATLELVDHIELLRTAAGPVRAITGVEQRWTNQEKALADTNRAAAFAVFVSTLASVLPIAGIASYLIFTEFGSAMTILALLILVGRAAAPLGELATAGLGINDLRASLDNYKKVTNTPELPEPIVAKSVLEDYRISVQLVKHSPALNNIHVDIPAGGRVLVTGPSGSGKSTLLELLMRFDDPEQGQIKIGDIKLDDIPYEELASHIAYVAQDPIVFTGSLAENIRIGNPQATDEEVETIARKATLGSIIDRSPDGIHQSVGQQGTALSGGERQRVALARALIKNAPILVLDEATSALDEATEQEVINTIHSLSATVLFATHRDTSIWKPTQSIYLNS